MQIAILSRRSSLYSTSRLVRAAQVRGHGVVVADPLRCQLLVGLERSRLLCDGRDLGGCDVVIPRIGASITDYGLAVVAQLEMLGVSSINGSVAIDRARDKLKSLQVLVRAGVPVPRTAVARGPAGVRGLVRELGGPPVVLKIPRGTQGVGVMLAETVESAESIVATLSGMGRHVLVQQFIAEARGRDMRLLVVDGEVVGSMRREARGLEFRANVHRGGSGRRAVPTPQARSLALEATAAVGLDLAGVDLIETAKGPVVLEVNASPGFEELERTTGCDVAEAVLDLAARRIGRLEAVG